ncbi:MAG TPA: WD40 repeat domain-containing protein, partial [Polyangia bacterium]|nr:WD40 repeat domain-containing protein [Polyangia bacterium]
MVTVGAARATALGCTLLAACASSPQLGPSVVEGTAGQTFADGAVLVPQSVSANVRVVAAAISNDGLLAALGTDVGDRSNTSVILVLNMQRQVLVRRMEIPFGRSFSQGSPLDRRKILALALSPDSSEVRSISADGQLCVFPILGSQSGRCTLLAEVHRAALSSDGKVLATKEDGSSMSLRSASDGSKIQTATDDHVRGVAVAPDGVRVAVLRYATTGLFIWDTRSKDYKPRRVDLPNDAFVDSVAFDRDGSILASTKDAIYRVPATESGNVQLVLKPTGGDDSTTPYMVTSFADGRLAFAQGSKFEWFTDGAVPNGVAFTASPGATKLDPLGPAAVLASSVDGQRALTVWTTSSGLFARSWSARDAKLIETAEVSLHTGTIRGLAALAELDPAGKRRRIGVIATTDRVWAYDLESAALLQVAHVDGPIESLSADAQIVISINAKGVVPFRVGDGVELSPLRWASASPDPPNIFSAWARSVILSTCSLPGRGCRVVINGTTSGDPIGGTSQAVLPAPRPNGIQVISADGARMARVGDSREHDCHVELWNLSTAKKFGEIAVPWMCLGLALDEHGHRLLVGYLTDDIDSSPFWDFNLTAQREVVRIFNVDSGRPERLVDAPDGVAAVALSPNGATAVVGGYSGKVGRIDVSSGKLKELRGHSQRITDVAVSDAGHIVSASDDGTARIWNPDTGRSVVLVLQDDDWLAYTDDGFFDSSRHGERLAVPTLGAQAFALDQTALFANRPDKLIRALRSEPMPERQPDRRLKMDPADPATYFEQKQQERLHELGLDVKGAAPAAHVSHAPEIVVDPSVYRDAGTPRANLRLAFSVKADQGLKAYNAYVNGVPVHGSAGKNISGTSAEVVDTVALGPGTNHVDIAAVGTNGLWARRESLDAAGNRADRGRLFFVGFGADGEGIQGRADARALGKAFSRVGFRIPIPQPPLTEAGIDAAARVLENLMRPDDTIVVFVAGHGTHKGADVEILASGAAPTDPKAWIPLARFQAVAARSPARKKLLLVDACASGKEIGTPPDPLFRGVFKMPADGTQLRDRYIYNDVVARDGVTVFSASRGYEAAGTDPASGHG